MRVVDVSELEKFERRVWTGREERFRPLAAPPDPDLVGKFFTIWTSSAWGNGREEKCDESSTIVGGLIHDLFGGRMIHRCSRDIPGHRPYCQVSIVPVAALVHPRGVPDKEFKHGTLWLKASIPDDERREDPNLWKLERIALDIDGLADKVSSFRSLDEDLRHNWHGRDQKKVQNCEKLRVKVYSMFFSQLFGEGSYLHVDDKKDESYLVTPFEFPPGYVRDTARALEAEYGRDAKLVQEFIRLTQEAQHLDAHRTNPDYWWTTCKRPSWVFMILFSRLMGQGQWNYSLAHLEREFHEPIDWSQSL